MMREIPTVLEGLGMAVILGFGIWSLVSTLDLLLHVHAERQADDGGNAEQVS
jgi:hypothetical protein